MTENEAGLAEFIPHAVGTLAGPLHMSLLSGGRSNLTYVVTDGRSRWVLRRPPLGHVLDTAHDMQREYRVISALHGTNVPVPRAIAYCDDPSILGAPFYLMDLVEGTVYRTADDMAKLDARAAQALGQRFIDVLAELHSIDPRAVGLGDFGRPDGYLARQVRRWTRQLASSRSREVPGFAELSTALAEAVPESPRGCIVHGDFRLDNAIVATDDPSTIRAILDWEMATLGDPLTDVALFYLYWEGWQGVDNPIAATPAEQPGWPPWRALAERYVRRTGLDLSQFAWYQAFAYYKFGVICEGIHFRYSQGLTVGEGFEAIGKMVPEIVQRGLAALHGEPQG